MKLFVLTLGLFGAGQRSSSFAEVPLMRFAGIILFRKGFGAAELPGQAPREFTTPAQGSYIWSMTTGLPLASRPRSLQMPAVNPDLQISEKFPARSAASGTVAVKGSLVRRRNPSPLRNQNVLLRCPIFSGPPAFAPN